MADLVRAVAHGHSTDAARRVGQTQESTQEVIDAQTAEITKLQDKRKREDDERLYQQQLALELQDPVKPSFFPVGASLLSFVCRGGNVSLSGVA